MSRAARNKCGYAFRPTPLELDPRWSRASFYQRALAGELFRVAGGDPIPVGVDWRETLCRRLEVHGKERTAAKAALAALQEAGLMVVTEYTATVLFATTATSQQERNENATGTQQEPDLTQPPENTQVRLRRSDIDQEKIKRESDTPRVREGQPFFASDSQSPLDRSDAKRAEVRAALTVEFSRRFNALEPLGWTQAGSPSCDQLASALARLPDWQTAMRAMLECFFADAWCHARHFPIDHLARNPQKYLAPRQEPLRALPGGKGTRRAPAKPAPHAAFDNQPDDVSIVLEKLEREERERDARRAAAAE